MVHVCFLCFCRVFGVEVCHNLWRRNLLRSSAKPPRATISRVELLWDVVLLGEVWWDLPFKKWNWLEFHKFFLTPYSPFSWPDVSRFRRWNFWECFFCPSLPCKAEYDRQVKVRVVLCFFCLADYQLQKRAEDPNNTTAMGPQNLDF